MSLSDNYQPDVSIGNGVTLIYTGSWKVFNSAYFVAQLQEIATGAITDLTLGADYTLTFNEAGYEMTLLIAAPDSDYYVIRSRNVELSQTNPYRTSKGFQGRVIEDSFDKLTAIDQDQQDQIDRAMKFQVGSQFVGIIIEDPIDGRSLKWDVPNNKIVNSDTDPDTVYNDSEGFMLAAQAAAGVATTQAGISTTQAALSQSWAIDPIGSRPEGSAKYWAEQAASYAPPNNNWTATADPTSSNDQSQGWTVGSYWYNSVGEEVFVCVDNTVGAAIWIKTTLTIDEIYPLLDQKEDKTIAFTTYNASSTLANTDTNKTVRMNVASANNITVPNSGTVSIDTGKPIVIKQIGAGQTTILADSGVTLIMPTGFTNKLRAQYSSAVIYRIGTNSWYVEGDLEFA